jgi:hypothetical protein
MGNRATAKAMEQAQLSTGPARGRVWRDKLEVQEVPAPQKTDEELADGIMDTQLAIFTGWDAALLNFDKVLTSSSDASAQTDFAGVVRDFFVEKLMGEIISRSKVPGAGDAFALLGKLEAEAKRATAAGESASLRDFIVKHRTALGKLQQSVLSLKDDFKAKVRITREKMERGGSSDEYGMLRLNLVEGLERLDARLKTSRPEDLFLMLSQEWIRAQKTTGAWGTKYQAVVIIRLNPDYSVKNGHIEGAGGQKLAEQLLKDSPGGVDLLRMPVPRRIVHYAKNGWPQAILNLDASGRNINVGAYAEGDAGTLERYIRTRGLPPVKTITGD